MSKAVITPTLRAFIERWVQEGIDILDAVDAATEDMEPEAGEPDDEDEIISEDDAVVSDLRQVGRQWA